MSIQESITKTLVDALAPLHIEVLNESYMHNVPENSETHFKIVCVSSAFEDLRPVQRHQKIYTLLAGPLDQGVHALSMHLYTQAEWRSTERSPNSPNCLGGDGSKFS